MVELYWRALTRDVPFTDYGTNPFIRAAAAELGSLSPEREVTSGTLFRDELPGTPKGPFLSQFLWRDVPYGAARVTQRYQVPLPRRDYLADYPSWLAVQRGADVTPFAADPTPRHLRSGRDLAAFVQRDFPYQAFLNAALILLEMGAPRDVSNPYLDSSTQGGFVTFGPPHLLHTLALVTDPALKAAWYQKWLVHRRLRPETFSGRVHSLLTGGGGPPVHQALLGARALRLSAEEHGTYLLPQAYPEGSPMHPSYPAGHAVIAGACATILKAFFDESFVLPDPVQANRDGTALERVETELTVGGELDKLAANVTFGRDTAGAHYRSDGTAGLALGERVALEVLAEQALACPEPHAGFAFTAFDGRHRVIRGVSA